VFHRFQFPSRILVLYEYQQHLFPPTPGWVIVEWIVVFCSNPPLTSVSSYSCTCVSTRLFFSYFISSSDVFAFRNSGLLYRLHPTKNKTYEAVSKSFRTGHLERELHMVQLSATRCSCVASQRVFIVIVYFVIDSVRKLFDTPPLLFIT
jgi:hypothetical protein